MKTSILTLVAILITSSVALADGGRSFFGDGSPENRYVAGKNTSISNNDQNNLPANFIGRDAFGDGSLENNYKVGDHAQSITTFKSSFNEDGRNSFGDGSPLN